MIQKPTRRSTARQLVLGLAFAAGLSLGAAGGAEAAPFSATSHELAQTSEPLAEPARCRTRRVCDWRGCRTVRRCGRSACRWRWREICDWRGCRMVRRCR